MPAAVFNRGTRPSYSMAFVTLLVGSWTPLWGDDDTRSFAAVVGGTGAPGEIIYLTDDPSLNPGDPGVAEHNEIRGPLYVETRGQNALYARISTAPLAVRTTTTVQVPKVPQPSGLIGTRGYHVETRTGGGPVTYFGGDSGVYAPILPRESDRLRVTLLGDTAEVLFASRWADPSVLSFLAATEFTSSGPNFPGPLPLEGGDAITSLKINDVGEQTAIYTVADYKVAL